MRQTLILAVPALLLFASFAASAETKGKSPVVVMKTSMGTVKIELYPDKTPVTVKNFLDYVDSGFYSGTTFHRVIANFMIQGGGFDKEMAKKATKAPIVNEAKSGLKNATGTIAMARTGDPNSATSQFFVNVVDNPALDYKDDSVQGIGYCAFGKVIEGMDVVAKLKAVPTTMKSGMGDVPVDTLLIESIARAK
jgi:cyclophilin family peptidyl-prolyl cis-trans isomerase